MEKVSIPSYRTLEDLYSHYPPEAIPIEIQKVKQYIIQSSSWYKRNVSKVEDIHEEEMQMLESLKSLTENMLIRSGSYLCYVYEDSKVNLEPFNEFLKKNNISDVEMRLEEITKGMRQYLHEGNILEYKSCSKFMDELKFLFNYIA